MTRALVFDLGGTHLRAGVLDARGAVRDVVKRRITSVADGASPGQAWERVRAEVLAFERAHRGALPASAPIVAAVPGPVHGHRVIADAPTLAGGGAPVPDLAGELEAATGRPVHLVNDVSAAAWHFSTLDTADRFLVVTISSGIGSKLFDRRHPDGVLDAPVYAGEIGHHVVDDRPDAPVCDCGGRGHLGAIASGRGVAREARRRAHADPGAFRASWLGGQSAPATLENEAHLVPAALAGDAWTLAVIRDCTRPLARTLLAVVMAAGVERVFLMGGFAQALGDVYLDLVRSQLRDLSRYSVVEDTLEPLVRLAAPHDEAGLHGCAVFVRTSERFRLTAGVAGAA